MESFPKTLLLLTSFAIIKSIFLVVNLSLAFSTTFSVSAEKPIMSFGLDLQLAISEKISGFLIVLNVRGLSVFFILVFRLNFSFFCVSGISFQSATAAAHITMFFQTFLEQL